jgi:hypothetical protein
MAVLNQTTNTGKETMMNNQPLGLSGLKGMLPHLTIFMADKTYHILNPPDLNGIVSD